ncbi:MAG: DUF1611 domain-containing protein [Candidatus Caenarcaniphilales bacterium]|nr:DUF1611 domain-containing protein [Candidatus Caenarcaniphilales bacterium]
MQCRNFAQLLKPEATELIILTEGFTATRHAKTAEGVIRYGSWDLKSLIDSEYSENTAYGVHVAKSLAEALNKFSNTKNKALLLGIAPVGGKLPESWLEIIKEAIKNSCHIISGLHDFLEEKEELKLLAEQNQVYLWDLRNPNNYPASRENHICELKERSATVISMVGSDCSVGKMCSALEIKKSLNESGLKSSFVATGQTGIAITGSGIPLDRIIGDFMAGSLEKEIEYNIETQKPDFVIVEGQGSLLHPAYSSVTLALIHGSNPDALILCHKADLEEINGNYGIKIPDLKELIKLYEDTANLIKKGKKIKILGISINTSALDSEEARNYIERVESKTGLAATDPIRYGVNKITKSISSNFKEKAIIE